MGTVARTPERVLQTIRERTEQTPAGCHLWTGRVDNWGYVRLNLSGWNTLAHRAVYEAARGPIPDGYEIDHVCHTRDTSCVRGPACPHRRCLNPDHLEPVSHAENGRRMGDRLTHCVNGHAFTPENTYDRLPAKGDSGRRDCRTCIRERQRRCKARRIARTVVPA